MTAQLQIDLAPNSAAGIGCEQGLVHPLRVLVACEYSGTVRDAFAARGHDAMSCDLLPTDRPGKHYQGDVRDVLDDGWDPQARSNHSALGIRTRCQQGDMPMAEKSPAPPPNWINPATDHRRKKAMGESNGQRPEQTRAECRPLENPINDLCRYRRCNGLPMESEIFG